MPAAVFTLTGCSVNNVGQCFLLGGYVPVTCPDAFHCIYGCALAWAISRRPVITEACDGSVVRFVVEELALLLNTVGYSSVSIIPPALHMHSFTCMLLVPRQMGEA